jgi:hypothetical protein
VLERFGPLAPSTREPRGDPDRYFLLLIPQPPDGCDSTSVVAMNRQGDEVRIRLRSRPSALGICPPPPISLVALSEQSLPVGWFEIDVRDTSTSGSYSGFSEEISTTTSCFDGKPTMSCVDVTSAEVFSGRD